MAYRAITLTVLFPQHYTVAVIEIKFEKLEVGKSKPIDSKFRGWK